MQCLCRILQKSKRKLRNQGEPGRDGVPGRPGPPGPAAPQSLFNNNKYQDVSFSLFIIFERNTVFFNP